MLSSPIDIAIALGVALIVFGPKKVPEFGKALGQGIANFKRGLHEAQDEIKTAINEEPKPKSEEAPTAAAAAAPQPAAVKPEEVAWKPPTDDKPNAP